MKNLVIIAGVALLGAVWIHNQKNPLKADDMETAGSTWFLSDFREQINNLDRVTLHKGEEKWTLKRQENQWVSENDAAYPLDFEKVREFLFNLSILNQPEAKTSKAERWIDLQLDPAGETEPNGRIEAWVGENPVLNLWVGKSKWQPKPGVYLRHEGENQTWLALGKVQFPWKLSSWMDTKIISLSRENVKDVKISGNVDITLSRRQDKEGEDTTSIQSSTPPPPNREWAENGFSGITGAISFLSFENPVDIAHEAFDAEPLRTITWTSLDGGVAQLKIFSEGKEFISKIMLSQSPPQEIGESNDTGQSEDGAQKEAEEVEKVSPEPQVVEDARWNQWGFRLSATTTSTLLAEMDEWLKPEVEEEDNEE